MGLKAQGCIQVNMIRFVLKFLTNTFLFFIKINLHKGVLILIPSCMTKASNLQRVGKAPFFYLYVFHVSLRLNCGIHGMGIKF